MQGFSTNEEGLKTGFNTMVYSEPEVSKFGCHDVENSCKWRSGKRELTLCRCQVERIANVAFQLAQKRKRRLCSVEKSNVLEVSQLWKEVVTRTAENYPDVELSHMSDPLCVPLNHLFLEICAACQQSSHWQALPSRVVWAACIFLAPHSLFRHAVALRTYSFASS